MDTEGLAIRIFVVDDASTDATPEAIEREFPDVTLIKGTGFLHYAGGTNLGILKALRWDPDYVLTANDDSIFDSYFLQSMIETATEFPQSIVGALLLLWNEPHRVFQVGQRWQTLKGGWVFPNDLTAFNVPARPFTVECIVGNCVLFPVAAIRENGLMDEKRFPFGWGDAQYLVRMRKAGWQLLVDPRARVWCEPNTYPDPLHSGAIKRVIQVLFSDTRHPLNLHRQFTALWHSAPSRPKGIAAFVIYLAILVSRTFRYLISRVFRFERSGDLQ